MTYANAVRFLAAQDRNIRKVDNVRIFHNGWEYRLTYCGGFAPYVGIDRRAIGRRKFEYFGGVDATHCWTVGDVMKLVNEKIGIKEVT